MANYDAHSYTDCIIHIAEINLILSYLETKKKLRVVIVLSDRRILL